MITRCAVLFTAACVALCAVLAAYVGAQTPAEAAAQPLRFRRVYAPADRVQDWPRGDTRYVPVDPAEFERLLETSAGAPTGAATSPNVRVASASYRAEVDASGMLVARGTLEIIHETNGPAVLKLGPVDFALRRLAWQDKSAKAAISGQTEDDELAVLVEGAGALELEWASRATRDAAGALNFAIEVPRSPISSFAIELPKDYLLESASGERIASPLGPDDRTVRIELGGQRRLSLRLVPAPQAPIGEARKPTQPAKANVLLRTSTTYDASQRGVDVSVQWKLDVLGEPLRRMEFSMNAGLRLISARYGETNVPWSVTTDAQSGISQVVLDLPEPIAGSDRVLRLAATCPSTIDRPWRLPTIRPSTGLWQDGTTTLLVRAPLVVSELIPRGCRQTRSAVLVAPSQGESFELQCFAVDASADLTLRRQQVPARMSSGTHVVLDADARGTMVTDFLLPAGERFALEAEVGAGWSIDDVRSTPADALADWNVERRGPTSEVLSVRLSRPLSAEAPLKLTIRGRASRESGPTRALRDFEIARFHATSVGQQLLSIATSDGFVIELPPADAVPRIAADKLSLAQRSLFAEVPSGAVLFLDASTAEERIEVHPEPLAFSAETEVTVDAAPDVLVESYAIACTPSGPRIDRVVVQFTHQRSEPPRFTIGADGRAQLSARRLTADEQRELTLDTSGEAWEVTLLPPRSATFELRAVRSSLVAAQADISLAVLAHARPQSGRVVVRAAADVPISIENRGLRPVTEDAPRGERAGSTRAVFAYDPDDAHLGLSVIRPSNATPLSGVWAASGRVETMLDASGQAVHRVTYELHNSGRKTLTLRVPQVCRVDRVMLDDAQVSVSPEDRVVAVDLPADKERSTLTARLTSFGVERRFASSIEPPEVEIDAPVLAQLWEVHVPPGFDAIADRAEREGPAPAIGWRQRLFGPLANTDAPAANPPSTAGDVAGWTRMSIPLSPAKSTSVLVIHRSATRATVWASFALVATAAWWLLRHRAAWLALLATTLAATALLVPPRYSPVASGALLGAVAALVATAVTASRRTTNHAASEHGESPSVHAAPRNAASAVLVLLVALLPVGSRAQNPATTGQGTLEKSVHRVYIPVDDKQKPTGGKYQVPEALFSELRKRVSEATDEPRDWLLAGARYSGALERDTLQPGLIVGKITARLDLHVFNDGAVVRLPLGQSNARPAWLFASLDEQRVTLMRVDESNNYALEGVTPGAHRLEVELQAESQQDELGGGFDLAVPRAASATFELSAPAVAPALEFPTARGTIASSDGGQRWRVELGNSPTLSVRWSDSRAMGEPETILDVEKLLWLDVRQGAVSIEARLTLRVSGGRLSELRLAVDPRLRVLPIEDDDSLVKSQSLVPGSPQIVRVELSRPVADQVTIPLKFLIAGSPGVGQVQLPSLEVVGARTSRGWLAIAVDPALELDPAPLESITQAAVPDFMGRWGAAATVPQATYQLSSTDRRVAVSTRPRESVTTARQEIAVRVDRARTWIEYEGRLQSTDPGRAASGASTLQHRLVVPDHMAVTAASLRQDGVERLGRWSHDEARGLVTLFLTAPVTGTQTLTLRGWLETPFSATMPLPWITLDDGEVLDTTVRVWRSPSVLVTVESDQALPEPPGEVARVTNNSARQVSAFRVAGPAPDARLKIARNQPQWSQTQWTRLWADGAVWEAEIDYECHVSSGVLDALAFDLPADWTGPFTLAPSVPYDLTDSGVAGRRRLIVRPGHAISGDYRLSIRAPVATSATDRLTVPEVTPPASAEATQRFVSLPTSVGLRTIAWETSGLAPERVADSRQASSRVYRAVDACPRAALAYDGPQGEFPHVKLADVHVLWLPDGTARGIASFDVDAQDLTACSVRMPTDAKWVRLSVNDQPATPAASDDGWTIPFVSGQAAQRIEIVFELSRTTANLRGEVTIACPSVAGIPTDATRWTVYNGADAGEGFAHTSAEPAEAPPSAISTLPESTFGPETQRISQELAGNVNVLVVRYPRLAFWNRHREAMLAAALACVAISGLSPRVRQWLRNAALRWPHSWGVALGLAWWLWLWPSGVGLGIAALSAYFAVRQGTTSYDSGSTVVRAARPTV